MESVTAPVAAETAIWFAVPPSERTPVLVTLPFKYARPELKVVVATQVGTPPTSARVWPFVPADVVASAPEPLPYGMEPDWIAAQPVPPLATATMPVTFPA